MLNQSIKFHKKMWSVVFSIPTDKQTDTGENMTSLAEPRRQL